MPDQPDYYATIHWGSQGQAVQSPRDWDVDEGDSYYFYAVEQLLAGTSNIYSAGAVPAGKILLVDSWGGTGVEIGLFSFYIGATVMQELYRPARDGFVVVLPRPERFVEGEQCVLGAENHGAIASIVRVFYTGRLVDA